MICKCSLIVYLCKTLYYISIYWNYCQHYIFDSTNQLTQLRSAKIIFAHHLKCDFGNYMHPLFILFYRSLRCSVAFLTFMFDFKPILSDIWNPFINYWLASKWIEQNSAVTVTTDFLEKPLQLNLIVPNRLFLKHII